MPEAADLSTPLAWALAYANIGWHVLPLEPGQKQPLGRLVPRGMLDATTDIQTIRSWWMRHPKAGVGIALAQSGLVAVDVDPRNGGTETFEALQADHGSLRSEVSAFTGGGGEHHVFVVPHGVQITLPGTLGPGIDLKANGYIVVEPSVHPSGRQYIWESSSNPLDGVAPSPLPDWLRSLRVPLKTNEPMAGAVPVDARQAKDVREALYVLNADEYSEWVQAGMALHSTGWGQPAYAMWCSWSQQSPKFDATVCRQKWESFHAPGERGAKGVTLAWIFGRAQSMGWTNPASVLPKLEQVRQQPQPDQPAQEAADDLPDMLSLAELQQRSKDIRWVIKHVFPAESLGIMFGGSGTFKSFIALDAALHIAHGLPWMGKRTKKGQVVFIAAEGGTGLWRRIEAWHQHRGLSWQGAEIYVVPVAVDLSNEAYKVAEKAGKLNLSPALVVVDTLSQTLTGEENSATDMSAYMRELGLHFRLLWQCAVLVVHHTGHAATERPRGSSTLRANADFMFGVFRDEKEMLATLTHVKQKDGELLSDATFAMHVADLGKDEDGEVITSLAAWHVGDPEKVQEVREQEAQRGRGGRQHVLMTLVQNGMSEKELRKAFYDEMEELDADSKKKAFYRARDRAAKDGLIEIAEGFVIDLRRKK